MEITIKIVDGKINVKTSEGVNNLELLGILAVVQNMVVNDTRNSKSELEKVDE